MSLNTKRTCAIYRITKLLDGIIKGLFVFLLISFPYSIALRNIFLGLLLIFFLIYKVLKKDFTMKGNYLKKYILVFLSLSLLSMFKTPDLNLSIERLLSPLIRYISFYFIASELININSLNKYLKLIIYNSFIFLAYGMFDYIKGGTFFRGNGMGTLITFIFILFITLSIQKKYKAIYYNIFYFLTAMVSIYALYISYSRGAVLGLIFAITLWFGLVIYRNRENRRLIIISLVIFLLFTSLSTFFMPDSLINKFRKIQDIESSWSLKTRIIMWETSLNLIKKNPVLGIGIGNFKPAFVEYMNDHNIKLPGNKMRHDHPHNLFLFIAVEQGIISLLIFIYMYYKSYLIAFANINVDHKVTKNSMYGLILIGQLSSLFIHSLVDTTVRYGHVGFFILFFLIVNEKKKNNGADKDEN